ncbi:MAG: hypothetical protein K6F88_00355 [Ruminococcus sp.]|nr:hypothetical protein [Ruminococcus sp.]
MKLNIYDKKKIVKTFETDEYKLKWGVLSDLIDAIEIDDFNTVTEDDLANLFINIAPLAKDKIEYILLDMFEDITLDDIREAAVDDMAICLSDAVKYVFKQVKKNVKKSKN